MAKRYTQAYGYKFYVQLIKADLIDFDLLSNGLSGFMNIGTLLSNDASIIKTGTGTSLKIAAGTAKTITKAAVASNVATLTFGAAHGISVGASVSVANLPTAFAALNGNHTVTAVTTSSPFTLSFALTASNIAEATVSTGKLLSTFLSLDGTDNPVRFLGVTNAAPNEGESEETVRDYDDEAEGYDMSIVTGKTLSWSLEANLDHRDAAYQLYRIASKNAVHERLMIKYARIGPRGFDEATFGFGRFTGFQETNGVGSVIKFSTGIKAYGPYELDFTT